MKLKNQIAIVTGAGSGIGSGVAEVFAEQGAHVIIADRQTRDAEAVAQKIRSAGGAVTAVTCDVSDEAQIRKTVADTIAKHGRVDSIVNNAGVFFGKPFEESTVADWHRVLAVDLTGSFLLIHACVPHFLKQGRGAVVNIASVHTHASYPGAAQYAAAKWGVVGMTKALATEYASRNIRFNCISPGLIDTKIWIDLQAAAPTPELCKDYWWSNIPAQRIGSPREIGNAAAFLVSDEASYVTGANLTVDGGMTAQLVSFPSYENKPMEGKR